MIGFFVNTLVMRHDLSGDPRFIDLLERTRAMALKAYAHQDVPFEHLVEELNPERSVSHSPLFQVVFGLVNTPFEAVELPGVALLPLREGVAEDQEGTARFDMTLNVQETPAGLAGGLEYNTDLFDRGTVRRMLGHYAQLLEAIVDAPQARLSRLKILGEVEKRQQLIEWNARSEDFPPARCVHELFEEQAARSPRAIALVAEDRQLTYAEVDERANSVAHRLIEQGVAPGSLVGLCVEGIVERAVGLLAILKAGGAYVPLSAADPLERSGYLLEDAEAGLTVTQSWVRDEVLQGYPRTNPRVAVRASDLACVRYEADEAGVPAGRMVPHLGVLEESIVRGQESSQAWVASLLARCASGRDDASADVTGGAQIRGAAHYVLDRHGELLPVGAVGDLHVGGAAAGWGYLHRSSLTAERYVPDPFGAVPGGRLYRTAERARWTAGGKLQLVGRGPASWRSREKQRLQIERVLCSHEAVREAVVLAQEAGQGEQCLSAYVVERAPGAMPAERFLAQLKTHLRTLPAFCALPEEWTVLEALPRTAAGAVDRRRLPRPQNAGPEHVAPRTGLEKTLVEVWQEQLGVERVSVEDNYFTLGGDSIRSIALVAQSRQRGADFSIKDLFAHPTVSALASAIERGDVRRHLRVEEEIAPFTLLTQEERERLSRQHDMQAVEDAYPLSMMQQGMVLEALRYADLKIYQNGHCYQFNDAWDSQLFERALCHLMAKHPMLRTIYDFSGERPLQLVLKEQAPELRVVDLRHLDNAGDTGGARSMGAERTLGIPAGVLLPVEAHGPCDER